MIRPATARDAEGIAQVHVRTWQAAYAHVFPADELANLSVERRRALWAEYLGRDDVGIFVDESGGAVTGFVSVGASGDDDAEGELYAIYVEPARWGTGVGRALIEAGEERLRELGHRDVVLWVLDDNPRARRFYESAGWSADGTRRPIAFLGVEVPEVRYRKRL
ncbi:MAG TPA: GNAT family N-acetyltransferase [Gaiellaceae bacterium]|nr:GNAT family N-acetyltransferase [Gaiellaceae bacterium]